jgi:1,4-dihydroxy-2-naphthoate polyprenyltransferase
MRLPLTHPPVGAAVRSDRSVLHGLWRLADPKIALASVVPFCIGAALAWRESGSLAFGIGATAFAAILFVEVGKNAVNDLYDFRSGADSAVRPEERSPYSGGKRVLADRLLTERDLVVIASVAFALAAVLGTAVATATSLSLLLLGAAAALVSILYVMPPVKLAYRGFGELVVFAVYGPGIVFGAVLVSGGTIGTEAIAAGVMAGCLIAAVLLANELPDERADRSARKRTLVVRLGRGRATSLIAFLFLVAFAIPLSLIAFDGPMYLAGALAGAPVAAYADRCFQRQRTGPPVAGQTATLLTYVVTGLGLACSAILF